MLVVFVLMSLASGKIVENTQSGIFFTELGEARLMSGQWKICFYYNMSEYYEEVNLFNHTLHEVDSICHRLNDYNCRVISRHFKSEYAKMLSDVQKLNTHERISKRSAPLAFLGKFNHWLTGTVDEETATAYENKINEMAMAINERHTMESNQTTLIRKSIVAMHNETNSVGETLRTLHRTFRETLLGMEQVVDRNTIENRMNLVIQLGTLIIMEHKALTEKFERANPIDLIEFSTICDDLRHIEEKLQRDQRLPLLARKRADVYKILEMSYTRTRISNKILLLEISIPIVESRKYNIFKSTPIPIVHDGAMFGIKSEKKIIISNIDNKEYVEISESELKQCIQIEEKVFICHTTAPTIVSDFNACEADILFGEGSELPRSCPLVKIRNTTYVSEINKPGVYIITPNRSAKIRTICDGARVTVDVIVKQIALITEPNCVVRVGRYRLRQNGIFVTNHSHIGNVEANLKNLEYGEINPINLNLTSEISEIALIDGSNDFTKLIQEAEVLEYKENNVKKIEKLETDSSIQSFSIMGLSTSTTIILILLVYIILFKLCPLATSIARIVNSNV